MKFPSLIPVFPFDKNVRMRMHYYRVVLPYQLRKWYRAEVRPLFCSHKNTYVAADWSYTLKKCSNCHKTLQDLRKDNG